MENGAERRRSQRVQKISLVQANSFLIGSSLNLSHHGALIELHEPLKMELPVRLDLAVHDGVLEIQGRVVYVHQLEDGRYRIGLEFQRLSEQQTASLDRFLKESDEDTPQD